MKLFNFVLEKHSLNKNKLASIYILFYFNKKQNDLKKYIRKCKILFR